MWSALDELMVELDGALETSYPEQVEMIWKGR